MNPWLKVAKNIKLPDSSQPLVNLSELQSYEGNNLTLNVTLQALTLPEHVNLLRSELVKHFGDDLQLHVTLVNKGKGQTLKRLRQQEFNEEKLQKLDKISKTKTVKDLLSAFDASVTVDNITLYDADDKPRVI